MAKDTSNVKAGIFVVVGIILTFAVVVVLSDFDGLTRATRQVTVRFNLADGLKGLKEGATVTIGDHPAGGVRSIADARDEETGRIIGKRVTFEIPAEYQLYDNAIVKLNPPPLGGGTSLNIESVGYDASDEAEPAVLFNHRFIVRLDDQGEPVALNEETRALWNDPRARAEAKRVTVDDLGRWKLGESWEYEPGEELPGGVETTPMIADMVREMGIRDIERRRIRNIIRHVQTLTAELSRDPQRYGKIIEQARSLTARADEALAKINGILDDNRENAKAAVASARGILEDNRADLRSAIATAKDLLEKNKPVVDEALAYTRDVMKRVRDQTMDKITAAVDHASTTLAGARKTMEQLEAMATTQRPILERMIANLRLASDNLKLAVVEIRRAPWRLLYQPTEKEVDTENLYSAARSFLLAADSLETSIASLKGVVDQHGQRIDTADRNFKRTVDKLKLSVEKFDEAEQQFWDALKDQLPPPTSDK